MVYLSLPTANLLSWHLFNPRRSCFVRCVDNLRGKSRFRDLAGGRRSGVELSSPLKFKTIITRLIIIVVTVATHK